MLMMGTGSCVSLRSFIFIDNDHYKMILFTMGSFVTYIFHVSTSLRYMYIQFFICNSFHGVIISLSSQLLSMNEFNRAILL